MPLEGLGMPIVLPEVFPLLPLDLVQREGWGNLWLRVRCAQARFCLLGSFVNWGYWSCSCVANSCYFLCPIGSPSSSLYVRRGDGVGEWFGVLGYVLGGLSRLISACSARWWGGWAFLPGLPIFGLRGREVAWARPWSSGFRLRSCCSLCRSAYSARLSGRDAVSVDRLVSCLPLCGRCVSVGGLRTANASPVFALVVSVGPVVVFLTGSDPSDAALAWPIAAVAAIVHGGSFSLLARGSLWPLSVARSLSPFFMTASGFGSGCYPPLSACGIGRAAGGPGVSGGRMWGRFFFFFVPHPSLPLKCGCSVSSLGGSAASSFPPVVSWSGHSLG